MTDLMDILYSYARDYMVRGLLDREPEYGEACRCAAKQEEKLWALVGEEDRERVKDLLGERELKAFYEGEALFRAGFRLALELTR